MHPTLDGELSDEDLMLRVQENDHAAFGKIVQRWNVPVKRFLFRMVGNSGETDDLAQEVFVRVYLKRASYRPVAKFSTWCFSIAANLATDRLRWWRRRPVSSLDAWWDAGGDTADESAGGAQGGDAVVRQERIAAVRTAVAALPVDLRMALTLFEYEEQSMADIADALGCTEKAVENRLYRARQRLKRSLRIEGF